MVVSKAKKPTTGDKGHIESIFEEFCRGKDSSEILISFQKLKTAVDGGNCETGREFYATLKSKLQSWKSKSLWEVLDGRAKHKEYGNGKICEDLQVVVIGCGPIGLRTAIEIALLGAKVIIVEKRTTFGRNNVLHLWPFLIQDFRSIGAKRFYGKFCSGTLDHISIRILQCMLMKTALILGVQIYTGVTFEQMIEPSSGDSGWRCLLNPPFHPASQVDIDAVIGADGKKNVLPDFPQIEMRGSLAIGITLNLVYRGTKQEAAIPEVSGLAYHFKPQFFDMLYQKHGVRLENFVYYKNETHYFVMTAVKSSLLARGVLLMDYPNPSELLSPPNINTEKLKAYAMDAVNYGTNNQLLNPEFVINDRGKCDIAVFDFTSLRKAEHAARIVERKGHRLLMALVGDSLIEPFWPTGSGCARGVLSALDTAWMLRSFAMDKPPLQVLGERESVYKLLSATSVNNIRKKYEEYTINPFSRYMNVDSKRVKEVYHLYDSDDPVNADFRESSPSAVGAFIDTTKRRISIGNQGRQVKTFKSRRKSSSDDLDDKKDNKSKKSKQSRNRKLNRDVEEILDENNQGKRKISKSGKSTKKSSKRQSSESADEDAQLRRQRKISRMKTRDRKISEDNLDIITESPKAAVKKSEKANEEQLKEHSTKRWRLFGGTKPKLKPVERDNILKMRNDNGKSQGISVEKYVVDDVTKTPDKKRDENKNTPMKKKPESPATKNHKGCASDKKMTPKKGSLKEVSSPRNLNNKENTTPRMFRKPSDVKLARTEPFQRTSTRSNISEKQIHSTPQKSSPAQLKRSNSEIKERWNRFGSIKKSESPLSKKLKPTEQLTRKNRILSAKNNTESVLQNLDSLSPAAQRTAPVLLTLTPEKKDQNYSEGGAVSIVAGIAAMVALTTPLAVEEQQPLKEFQMKRQKILSGVCATEDDPLVSRVSPTGTGRKIRRDLTEALDNVDGSAKPVKRFYSFSTTQRNVKQKVDFENEKLKSRKDFGRHSLKTSLRTRHHDFPSTLDNTMIDLIKAYKFHEIDNTIKLLLNIFRCISTEPEAELPRRICIDGNIFYPLIWSIKEAKLFMIVSGWIQVGNFILLPKSKPVFEPLRVLMQHYRMLCEQEALDISCPLPDAKTHRRSSALQDLIKDDGKDTGSHSSDSGMGFSETASLKSLGTVVPTTKDTDDDVISNVVTGRQCTRSASIAMDPKLYLEFSNDTVLNTAVVDPCKYVKDTTDESVAVADQNSQREEKLGEPTKQESVSSSNEGHISPILKNEDIDSKDSGEDYSMNDVKDDNWQLSQAASGNVSPPSDDVVHESVDLLKQHNWEILESYEDCDQFRDVSMEEANELSQTLDDIIQSMNEPDLNDAYPEVFHDGQIELQISTTKEHKKNELDELFDTLDFVTEQLEPMRVVCNEKPKNNSKKCRIQPKSTETSRRREQFARSKMLAASEQRDHCAKSKRKTRNNGTMHHGTQTNEYGNCSGRRIMPKRAVKQNKTHEKDSGTIENNQSTALEETTVLLRRSRRIAESTNKTGRKAILQLESSCANEESSTDFNQAFVKSTYEDSKEKIVTDNIPRDTSLNNTDISYDKNVSVEQKKKRRIRRKSSIVKPDKVRTRAKRAGYKSKKDRSIDA